MNNSSRLINMRPTFFGIIPKFMVIAVQKDYHTKLFELNDDNIQNVSPGTVVQSEIVESIADFYISSQNASSQECSRPACYRVVFNEIGLARDQLHGIIHRLCHSYQLSATPIAEVTPLRYARRAIIRTKQVEYPSMAQTATF